MIEPRIYRAAFLPALFALVLVAFSLVSPPHALDQGLAADVLFTGDSASRTVQGIVSAAPDRHAGGAGDQATARRVAESFKGHGFTTTVDRFQDEGRDLVNVVGRRSGETSSEVVVLAARDSGRTPDAPGSAADTAALMEFARVFEGRALKRTLVLASVDGGELGDAGARRFAERIGDPGQVEAVIVVSDLGARESRGPLTIGWSNDTTRAGIALQRTLSGSLREELGSVPGQENTLSQFVRLSFPVAPGAQGVLLPAGLDAVRVSGAGEVSRGGASFADLDAERYGSLGRSVLRMIFTLDASGSEPARGETSYVTIGGMVLPAWALKLLAVALILPALVASIDALARARRRREPVAPWFVWLGANALPFVVAIVVVWLMVLVGLIDDAPPAPLDPSRVSLDGTAIGALVAALVAAALAWVFVRGRIAGRAGPLPDAASGGAACATSLALAVVALPIALLNPFAGLMLVPAVHLWMLATLGDARMRTRLILAAVGLAPLFFVLAYYMWRFELSPLTGVWYLLLLVAGNQTGVLTTLGLCALAGIAVGVGAILVAWARVSPPPTARSAQPDPDDRPSIFGPGGHAGPGMLGAPGSGAARR